MTEWSPSCGRGETLAAILESNSAPIRNHLPVEADLPINDKHY